MEARNEFSTTVWHGRLSDAAILLKCICSVGVWSTHLQCGPLENALLDGA